MTAEGYAEPAHAAPLQAIVVVGAAGSIWIGWDFTASALPATSTEKYCTVAVALRMNAVV